VHGNVVFNFSSPAIGQLEAFAAGYHEAGKILAAKMEASRGYPDYEGYPILFLYRHALELYLKALVYRGAKLLQVRNNQALETDFLLTNHRLSKFLPSFRAILESTGWKWNFEVAGLRSLQDFEALVRGIEEIDADSYCFRYPVTTKGVAAHRPHLVINVIAFAKKMDAILDLLDGVVTGLEYERDLSIEVEYILRELLKQEIHEP